MYGSVKDFSRAMELSPTASRTALYAYAYALLAMAFCHASPVIKRQNNNSTDTKLEDDDGKPDLTGQRAVAGVVLIIAGFILWAFGRRTYRITLFLTGFYLGAIIAYAALGNAEPDDGYASGKTNQTVFLAVTLAAGLVGGGVLYILCYAWRPVLLLWTLGGVTGVVIGLYMLAWADNGMIKSHGGRGALFAIAIVLAIAASVKLKLKMVSLYTAFMGAFSMMLGVEMFVRTGFATSIRAFTDGNHDFVYDVDKKVYGILGTVEVVFIFGALIQRRFYKGDFGPIAEEPPKEGLSDGKGKRWWNRFLKK